jgi:ParB family chromosome partitioning protein
MPSLRDKLADKKTKLSKDRERIADHPASLDDYQDGGFYNVEVEAILPNPDQPRQFFDPEALDELSESVRQKGVLQPILIRRDEEGKIILVAGERRLRAAKKAGLENIPTILTKGNPVEISIIENLQRENLKPIEEAEALARMMGEYKYTQKKLAKAIGKSQPTISEALSLNRLPEEIKREYRRADISRRLLVEIAKQKTPKDMLKLFRKAKEGNLKSDEVRGLARNDGGQKQRTPAVLATVKARGLTRSLEKLDLGTAGEGEKEGLLKELGELGRTIEEILG